jgi:hypothetical protein
MYMGGVQIKMRKHEGLTHEAAVVMHGLGEVIFGSSNWTTTSSALPGRAQLFLQPDAWQGVWFFAWYRRSVQPHVGNDTVNYVPFPAAAAGTRRSLFPRQANASTGGDWATTVDL